MTPPTIRCPKCEGPLRRSGGYLVCDTVQRGPEGKVTHVCRTKLTPNDVRFDCPTCGEEAEVFRFSGGRWEAKGRNGSVLRGDMHLHCVNGHRTMVPRPDELSPTRGGKAINRTRGFY